MSVFGAYSRYYNLLYSGKEYAAEAEYVHRLIHKHRPAAKTLLNLGCGTGNHDFEFAKLGYETTGLDISEEMLAAANATLLSLNLQPSTLNFLQGDIRSVRLNRTFDAVVSLFHVMSYQVANEDLQAVFVTAKEHLNPGGVFLFDCWYGPAVLTDQPMVRVKRLGDDEIDVLRIAEPVMHYNENVVDVNYQVLVTEKASSRTEILRETHRMRYLFVPEVTAHFLGNGFLPCFMGEGQSGKNLDCTTWNACFMGIKQ